MKLWIDEKNRVTNDDRMCCVITPGGTGATGNTGATGHTGQMNIFAQYIRAAAAAAAAVVVAETPTTATQSDTTTQPPCVGPPGDRCRNC